MSTLACQHSTQLRASSALRPRFTFIRPYSSATTRPSRARQSIGQSGSTLRACNSGFGGCSSRQVVVRPVSTTSQQTTSSSASAASMEALTWNRFFELRKKRRYINLGSSVLTAAAAVGAFGPVIAQGDIDGWAFRLFGADPYMVLGLTTFAVATGGWLCGPSFGSTMFRLWARRKGWTRELAEKEKSFYARVNRYRADPSSSSIQNPIPDYYGENVTSVKDYRRWLKDQRAFNLKKYKNIL